jgi:hypothetical protein
MGDSKIMKLSEQAQLDNQVSMLEMDNDRMSKEINQLIDQVYQLKLIIKSLSEVL